MKRERPRRPGIGGSHGDAVMGSEGAQRIRKTEIEEQQLQRWEEGLQ